MSPPICDFPSLLLLILSVSVHILYTVFSLKDSSVQECHTILPVHSYGSFGGNRRLHLQGPAILPLPMEPLISSAMSVDRLYLAKKTLRNFKT